MAFPIQLLQEMERRPAMLLKQLFSEAGSVSETSAKEIICPQCGYYCIGKGGIGCIDKPFFVRFESRGKQEDTHNG